MKEISKEELAVVIEANRKWFYGEDGGYIADLHEYDLRGMDLRGAKLSGAVLDGSDLRGANLQGACLIRSSLRYANLEGANLHGCYLYEAQLYYANLSKCIMNSARLDNANLVCSNLYRANLYNAELCGANLCDANLRRVKNLETVYHNCYTAFFDLVCPEKGSYIGYKKAKNLIVELEIPSDAMRSSATTRLCRASKAKVLSITTIEGEEARNSVNSDYDPKFVYTVGEIVEVVDFNRDRWIESTTGIHHFLTRAEAIIYCP